MTLESALDFWDASKHGVEQIAYLELAMRPLKKEQIKARYEMLAGAENVLVSEIEKQKHKAGVIKRWYEAYKAYQNISNNCSPCSKKKRNETCKKMIHDVNEEYAAATAALYIYAQRKLGMEMRKSVGKGVIEDNKKLKELVAK